MNKVFSFVLLDSNGLANILDVHSLDDGYVRYIL